MIRIRLLIFAIPFYVLGIVFAQDATCSTVVENALETVADFCVATGRNQACYGHSELTAVGRTADFTFDSVGDLTEVTALESLTTTAYDEANGSWGIALLRLQANLPDTIPGQNATLLVFGDVAIENEVASGTFFSGTINGSARVRSEPNTAPHTVIATLDAGTTVRVYGRNEAGDWVRIAYGNFYAEAWVATFLIDLTGDVMALPVVDIDAPMPNAPMQTFILKQGLRGMDCEAIAEGVLIHTPQGVGHVQFTINGVQVSMGSIVRILFDDELRIEVFTGSAIVQTPDDGEIVPAGTFTQVELSDDGTQAISPPTPPQPLTIDAVEEIRNILTSEAYNQIVSGVQIVPEEIIPLPVEEIDAAVETILTGFPALSGLYRFRNVSVSGDCPTANWMGRLDFNENGVVYSVGGGESATLPASGDDTYSGTTMASTTVSFSFPSPTTVEMRVSEQCEWVNVGVWQSD